MAKKSKKKGGRRTLIGGLSEKPAAKKDLKAPKPARAKKGKSQTAPVRKGDFENPGEQAREKPGDNAGAGGSPASAIGPAPTGTKTRPAVDVVMPSLGEVESLITMRKQIRELETEEMLAKADHSAKKKALENAQAKLGELMDAIFDPEKYKDCLPFPGTPAAKAADAAGPVNEGWRKEPIAKLCLMGKLPEQLAEAGIKTLGDLVDKQAKYGGDWWREIRGVGEGKAEVIEDALVKFWGEHPQYTRPGATVAEATPQPAEEGTVEGNADPAPPGPLLTWVSDEAGTLVAMSGVVADDNATLLHEIDVQEGGYLLGGDEQLYPDTQDHKTLDEAKAAAETVEREARAEEAHDKDDETPAADAA